MDDHKFTPRSGWYWFNHRFQYVDTVMTKKGKVRTWRGHVRALAKMHGITAKEMLKRLERCDGLDLD